MARQWFAEGVQINEAGEEEFFAEGVQWSEDQAAVGLSIIIAMRHYLQIMGAG